MSSVTHRLERAILEGELPPGHRLVQADLAARLQVSRTPVREALRSLEADGLVITVPRLGAFVADITVGEAKEVFDVRIALEARAAELAARRGREEGDRSADLEQWLCAPAEPREFHCHVVRLAGNHELEQMLRTSRITRLSLLIDRSGCHPVDDHAEIAAAIRTSDVARAGQLMARHLSLLIDRFTASTGTKAGTANEDAYSRQPSPAGTPL